MPALPRVLHQSNRFAMFATSARSSRRIRLAGVVAFAVLTLGVAAVVHIREAYNAVGDVMQWTPQVAPVPGAAPPPAVLVAPASPAIPAAASALPWTGPDFWHMINDDTARTTRAQVGLAGEIEAAIRAQIDQALKSAAPH